MNLFLAHAKSIYTQVCFVWGQEKCFQRLSRITWTLSYYLKDLSIVYLKFGSRFCPSIEDHRFIIDDEPNKAIINSQYNCIFLEAFNKQMSLSNIQDMDHIAFICGHSSKVSLGLLLWKTIIHIFDDSFCHPLCLWEPNYHWFKQYKRNNNENPLNVYTLLVDSHLFEFCFLMFMLFV